MFLERMWLTLMSLVMCLGAINIMVNLEGTLKIDPLSLSLRISCLRSNQKEVNVHTYWSVQTYHVARYACAIFIWATFLASNPGRLDLKKLHSGLIFQGY